MKIRSYFKNSFRILMLASVCFFYSPNSFATDPVSNPPETAAKLPGMVQDLLTLIEKIENLKVVQDTLSMIGDLDKAVGQAIGGVAGGVLRSATTTAACEGNENTGYIMAGKSTSVGAITGVSRSVVQMLNSKVGGKVERNNVVTELTEKNYMDYIYGEKWSGEETEPAYDGATFVAPVLPEGGEGTEGSGDNTDGTV